MGPKYGSNDWWLNFLGPNFPRLNLLRTPLGRVLSRTSAWRPRRQKIVTILRLNFAKVVIVTSGEHVCGKV